MRNVAVLLRPQPSIATTVVMPGLGPGIHLLREKGWIAGSSPAMTPVASLAAEGFVRDNHAAMCVFLARQGAHDD
jgi:hypothetical protein